MVMFFGRDGAPLVSNQTPFIMAGAKVGSTRSVDSLTFGTHKVSAMRNSITG